MSIQKFVRMTEVGIAPIVVFQKMCTERNMNPSTLQNFMHHCVSSGLTIHREGAECITESFMKYTEKIKCLQHKTYDKMLHTGVPLEAVKQRAELDGIEWNPLSNNNTNSN